MCHAHGNLLIHTVHNHYNCDHSHGCRRSKKWERFPSLFSFIVGFRFINRIYHLHSHDAHRCSPVDINIETVRAIRKNGKREESVSSRTNHVHTHLCNQAHLDCLVLLPKSYIAPLLLLRDLRLPNNLGRPSHWFISLLSLQEF